MSRAKSKKEVGVSVIPFDPISSWLVVLLTDGYILLGEKVSPKKVAALYKKDVRESNASLNSALRQIIKDKSKTAILKAERIVAEVNFYGNRFEYQYGAIEFEPDVQEAVIAIYQDCVCEHKEKLLELEERYNALSSSGACADTVRRFERYIDEEKNRLTASVQLLEEVKAARLRKIREQEEKKKQEDEYRPKIILFLLILLLVTVVAFAFNWKFIAGTCVVFWAWIIYTAFSGDG